MDKKALLMKILLLGVNGQIGWELQNSLASLGQLKSCDRDMADLEDLDSLRNIIRDYKPNIIVNAAAYTAVDSAESEKNKAYRINHKAVKFLAEESKYLNAWLIHYSSDYVFDGKKIGPYTEIDAPNPLSVYGMSKWKGEQSVIKSGCKYIIFRTSWVYSSRGKNFVKTMLRLYKEQKSLKVVDDQIGSPISAELIANISAMCLYRVFYDTNFNKNKSGIYHLASAGKTSWHGLAKYIFEKSKSFEDAFIIDAKNIFPISASEYSLPAKRPYNSLLKTQKIYNTFGIFMPHWKIALNRLLQELYLHKES